MGINSRQDIYDVWCSNLYDLCYMRFEPNMFLHTLRLAVQRAFER
jgi:hypothetical protein